MSIQVRELERQLDVELITRTTRSLILTQAGEMLATALHTGFETISDGLAVAQDIGMTTARHIVIACVPSLAGVLVPSILGRYRSKEESQYKIDIEELTSMEMIEALNHPEISFGIGPRMEEIPDGISFLRAGEEPLCVILPPNHVPADGTSLSFSTLASLPLVTLSGSVLLQNELNRLARQQGIAFQSLSEVRQVQTAIAMVKAGVGAAIVPRLALPENATAEMMIRYVTAPPLHRTIGILTASGKKLNPGALEVSRYMQAALVKALEAIDLEAGLSQAAN